MQDHPPTITVVYRLANLMDEREWQLGINTRTRENDEPDLTLHRTQEIRTYIHQARVMDACNRRYHTSLI